jgi:hypothetical protein
MNPLSRFVQQSLSSSLLDGYDEPQILRSSIIPICPMGADTGHHSIAGKAISLSGTSITRQSGQPGRLHFLRNAARHEASDS